MRSASWLIVAWGGIVLSMGGSSADATTFLLKAVKKNPTCTAPAPKVGEPCFIDRQCDTTSYPPSFDGVCGGEITPTSNVDADVGDIIVADVYVSDWSPQGQRARTWQVAFDLNSFFSGDAGAVVPVGWYRPPFDIVCDDDTDCPPHWPVCILECGFCVGADYAPEKGAFVDPTRPDYIFAGCVSIPDADYCLYRLGDTLLNPGCGPAYTPPPDYCATLALEVKPGSCGTFTISLLDSGTFIQDENGEPVLPLVLQPLTINTGPCECSGVKSTNPPNCAIDARQPSLPNGAQKAGWNSMQLVFEPPDCDTAAMRVWDFSVEQIPLARSEDPPTISSLAINGNTVTAVFNRRISLQAWTCVRYAPSQERFCMAHMPADVNNDRTSSAADILRLIDCLNDECWVGPLYQCDIDRSNRCVPADVLRVIDLLNGADAYDPWLGQKLPVPCPSAQ